jgi:hypothetical protein
MTLRWRASAMPSPWPLRCREHALSASRISHGHATRASSQNRRFRGLRAGSAHLVSRQYTYVCVCVRACVRACLRACACVCVRACDSEVICVNLERASKPLERMPPCRAWPLGRLEDTPAAAREAILAHRLTSWPSAGIRERGGSRRLRAAL